MDIGLLNALGIVSGKYVAGDIEIFNDESKTFENKDLERFLGIDFKDIQDFSDGTYHQVYQNQTTSYLTDIIIYKKSLTEFDFYLSKDKYFSGLLKKAIDQSNDMIYYVKPDSTVAYANDSVYRKLGYKKCQNLKVEQIDPDFPPSVYEKLWKRLKKEKEIEVQSVNRTKAGKKIDILASTKYVRYRGHEYNLAVIKDITGKIGMQSKMEVMEFAIQNSLKPCLWLDEGGHFVYVNQAACDLYGYSQEEFINCDVSCINKSITIDMWAGILVGLRSKQKFSSQREHTRKDGSTIDVIVHGTLVQSKKNIIVAFIEDVSELVSSNKNLTKLNEQLVSENENLRKLPICPSIISIDPAYKGVLTQIVKVGPSDATVLIQGETGTGKELIAKELVNHSLRRNQEFVTVNCSTFSSELMESAIFGHEKGAFTGATERRIGYFELADKGTIFLDEIGEMPLKLQAKLLRILENGEFKRLGSNKVIKVDVRIISATNRDLQKMVKKGKFRKDLYFRISTFKLNNVPLRERPEDIILLARHYLSKLCEDMNRPILKISEKDINELISYNWPGNVRELKNVLEKSILLSSGHELTLYLEKDEEYLDNSLEGFTIRYLTSVLKRTKGKVSGVHGAANILKVNEQTIYSKLKKYGIEPKTFRDSSFQS